MISHNHPPTFRPVPPPTDARDSWRALSGAWTPNRIAGRWMCTARGDAADGVIRPPRSRRSDLGVGPSMRLLAVIEGVMKFLTSLGVLLRENMSCAPAPNNPPLSRDWPGDACRDGCRFAAEKFGENAPDGPDDEMPPARCGPGLAEVRCVRMRKTTCDGRTTRGARPATEATTSQPHRG